MSPSPTTETGKQSEVLAVAAGRPREAVIFLHLPKTAGNTLSLAAWGAGLLLAGCALRLSRAHA